ncbi:TetR/AcrR family transcriptional regulator [Lactobacillus sp. LC28-10]|uniref:TetR/AcrR family transcriptional regulator n=1 Tax=Secundilactobacillus angelensis TaxID=2722706 RepID=A0ABX1KZC0_9LACO|nr:TetR/AcrR family transcriptional regulator [Secundilactobacillus angelensis]MCH5462799.1 TetR/AcrR family transcriptional regulator [Secundilactobacillus angelensis]NLR19288.1 TetR/AcrR family transcriptional regulator [Secundilactobacillus angelensis]
MKREAQLEKTHKAILDAARTLFLSRGYQGTSTRDIAKAVGITQPALYHHFADKEVIYLQVIQTVGGEIKDAIDAINQKGTAILPEERLVRITQVLTDKHPRDIFTVIHSSFADLKRENMGQLGMIFQTDYVTPIENYFESEDVQLRQNIQPKQAAEFYITSLSPLFSRFHQIGGVSLTQREHIRLLLDLILHGLVSDKS